VNTYSIRAGKQWHITAQPAKKTLPAATKRGQGVYNGENVFLLQNVPAAKFRAKKISPPK
jgi:hypothetical protein